MHVVLLAAVLAGIALGTQNDGLLSNSEIAYMESGGLAGRVREARFVALAGAVTVAYRSGDVRGQSVSQDGTLDAMLYVDLWREVLRIGTWEIASPGRSRGMDLVEHRLTIRQDNRMHTIRWDDGAPMSGELQQVWDLGQRLIATAKDRANER